MSHSIENLLITCMDFRLAKKHSDWAEEILGNNNYDLVSFAGAQKALLDEDTKETVFKQIKISSELHGIKTVSIIAHEDCGAYGGSKVFNEWEKEKAKYTEDLERAEELIKERHPAIDVKKYILRLDYKIEDV